jgi:dTDP-4-amino-4,6-dideoxygalactose transaminase
MINVTKTYFPNLDNYVKYLKIIWQNEWLTNRGQLVIDLEEKLREYLKVDNILITNNGTIPIQIALKLLGGEKGEIITTPFSYISTTSSIIWENLKPVFVDINPFYLTIDEEKIEKKINSKTTAILATHVFGNPCEIEKIEKIAIKHNLKVIYDAAHCFGVEYNNKSIFSYGDISTCSFHATKIFHTGEGGAIFCSNDELKKMAFYSHNFGHNGPHDFFGLGINAKISELQAAMGLAVLEDINSIFASRKMVVETYLKMLDSTKIEFMKIRDNTKWNYSYFPIIFQTESKLLTVLENLKKIKIYPRRYFYPSLNTINYVKGDVCEISESISKRILCLPLYKDLDLEVVSEICKVINNN